MSISVGVTRGIEALEEPEHEKWKELTEKIFEQTRLIDELINRKKYLIQTIPEVARRNNIKLDSNFEINFGVEKATQTRVLESVDELRNLSNRNQYNIDKLQTEIKNLEEKLKNVQNEIKEQQWRFLSSERRRLEAVRVRYHRS